MRSKNNILGIGAALSMLILILDPKTALGGAHAGIQMALEVLIPSLFPFFFLSILLTGSLVGSSISLIRPIEKLLRIPRGTGSIFLTGLLGGYPVGAQAVNQARNDGALSQKDANRMLLFCNQAGPAFLFGMGSRIFESGRIPWLLWAIQIFSACLIAFLIPCRMAPAGTLKRKTAPSLPEALKKTVRVMAMVCGWVILFRILLDFLERWIFWALPNFWRVVLSGILELSNGCCRLCQLPCQGQMLSIFSFFLGFGGLCVALQTSSVTESLDFRWYLPSKLLQGCLSFLLSIPCQFLLPADSRWFCSPWILAAVCLFAIADGIFLGKMQKRGSIRQKLGV